MPFFVKKKFTIPNWVFVYGGRPCEQSISIFLAAPENIGKLSEDEAY